MGRQRRGAPPLGVALTRPELSDEQEAAVEALRAWAREPGAADARSLRGLAGTGKTVAAAELVARLAEDGLRVAVVAPTGRAAAVLRRKGVACATTVHAAAYQLVGEDEGGGLAFLPRRQIEAPLNLRYDAQRHGVAMPRETPRTVQTFDSYTDEDERDNA